MPYCAASQWRLATTVVTYGVGLFFATNDQARPHDCRMYRIRRASQTPRLLRWLRLALVRACYSLAVATVAVVLVAVLAMLTALSMSDEECRPWLGLDQCQPIVQMLDLGPAAGPHRPVRVVDGVR